MDLSSFIWLSFGMYGSFFSSRVSRAGGASAVRSSKFSAYQLRILHGIPREAELKAFVRQKGFSTEDNSDCLLYVLIILMRSSARGTAIELWARIDVFCHSLRNKPDRSTVRSMASIGNSNDLHTEARRVSSEPSHTHAVDWYPCEHRYFDTQLPHKTHASLWIMLCTATVLPFSSHLRLRDGLVSGLHNERQLREPVAMRLRLIDARSSVVPHMSDLSSVWLCQDDID